MDGFKNFVAGYSDEQIVSIYLHNTEKKISEIARMTDKSIGELYRVLHNNNVTPNRLRINHKNVIDFAHSGLDITQIAELTGYTPRNVRYILAKEQNG